MNMLNINDFVERIYSLNDVNDKFWIEYLERIRKGMKVTWYHSAGFDLRPLHIINSLSNYYKGKLNIPPNDSPFYDIANELQNTDLIYSNIGRGMGNDFYSTFLNMWKSKKENINLKDSDLPHWSKTRCYPPDNFIGEGFPPAISYLSVEPFNIFTKEERLLFNNGDYGESANPNRELDGFAINLKYYSSTHITIIYFCLDDEVVKQLFDSYNIEIICLFENAPIGVTINSLFETNSLINIKYIFTDGPISHEHFDYWRLVQHRQFYEPIGCTKALHRGFSFCMGINKKINSKFTCPYYPPNFDNCIRLTHKTANPATCPYASS